MSEGRGGGDAAPAAGPSGDGGGERFIIPGRRFTEGQGNQHGGSGRTLDRQGGGEGDLLVGAGCDQR